MKSFASFHSIHDCELNRSFSMLEFENDVSSLSKALRSQYGLKRNDLLGYVGGNSYHFFITLFACHMVGISIAPISPNLNDREMAETLKCLCPSVIYCAGSFKKTGTNTNLPASGLVLLTSGSTGTPKAFLHSWEKVIHKLDHLQHFIPPDDLKFSTCFLPTHFGHGLIGNSLLPLVSGGTFYIQKPFSSQLQSLNTSWVNEQKITFFSTVPLVWSLWKGIEGTPMPSLKRVHVASANLNSGQFESARPLVPEASILNVFGMTELLSWAGGKKFDLFEQGNIGHLWGYESKIVNRELHIKAPHIYDFEILSSAPPKAATGDWLHTGDLVHYTENREIILDGRLKRQINRAGQKISPEEIENQLIRGSNIKEAVVISIPDPELEDCIVAYIVSQHDWTEESLRKELSHQLSPIKIPDRFLEIEEIPKNDRGKIDYHFLKNLAINNGKY